ncbi:MAG: adaptor protein MecA [Oscillospiraceae bacterium]|nr:adaptor protein MecA [Oscillospiraceae bacterium]
MTVQRLSAQSVKVQLTADELTVFLYDPDAPPDSPQMMRLISFMLSRAELASGIPLTEMPVTVELLTAADGSLSAYFTVQSEPEKKQKPPKTVRFAARFSDRSTLKRCCVLLRARQEAILSSKLYEYRRQYVLTVRLKRSGAMQVHHLLLEYGRPFRMSALNRARLAEYGSCIFEQDAVQCI